MDITQAAFDYSIRIAEIVKHLRADDKGYPLCNDLLKCGVDAGMFLRDPPDKKSAADCLDRADYLLEIAVAGGYLTKMQTNRIRESGQKLIRMTRETSEGGTSI